MGKAVMVVDDELDNVKITKAILEKEGYEIITANSGDDCLEKLKSGKKPDLILMDIMMPGTPVKEVVAKIKGIKIVYLSSVRMSNKEKDELKKTGNVIDFLEKPYDVKELVRKIKKIIG